MYESDRASLPFLQDEFCIYSTVFLYGEESGYSNEYLLDNAILRLSFDSAYEMHIRAKRFIEEKKYLEGYEILHAMLFNDKCEIPEPMLYFVLGDIELCCKEINDFKSAYDFSKSKLELMQKLLS